MPSPANSRYIGYPVIVDARTLIQAAFVYLAAKIPGWTPAEGNLDVWILEATSSEAADIATLVSQVPKAIFRYFGGVLFGIQPIDATSATVNTTWYLTDSLGHTIPAGTQVSIADIDGTPWAFRTATDVIVPGGSSVTAVGQVVLVAINEGTDSTDLGAAGSTVDLLDGLAWVDHITQTTATAGGVDAESDDDYLDRLSVRLQLMTPRPILPRDFAILARDIGGVQRATAIDNYDPVTHTYTNERMVTVVALDPDGIGVSALTRAAIAAYLDAMREVNFIVNTMDPSVNVVDVTVAVTSMPGYGTVDVHDRVVTTIRQFLNPAIWGISQNDNPNDPVSWNNQTQVYYLELAAAINNTPGVDLVQTLTIGLGGGAQVSNNIALTGVAPIPNPGVIVVTVA